LTGGKKSSAICISHEEDFSSLQSLAPPKFV